MNKIKVAFCCQLFWCLCIDQNITRTQKYKYTWYMYNAVLLDIDELQKQDIVVIAQNPFIVKT